MFTVACSIINHLIICTAIYSVIKQLNDLHYSPMFTIRQCDAT